MQVYTCPTCGERMERDLLLFVKHTDNHIVEEIKRKRPNWVTSEGYCPNCLDYFKKAIGQKEGGPPPAQASMGLVNIGSEEGRKRVIVGAVFFALSLLSFLWLYARGVWKPWRLSLTLPLFVSMLGFFQAKKNLCVVLAQKGTCNLDHGEQKVANESQAAALRRESFKLLIFSFVCALALAFVACLVP